jgi:hypothetical protein
VAQVVDAQAAAARGELHFTVVEGALGVPEAGVELLKLLKRRSEGSVRVSYHVIILGQEWQGWGWFSSLKKTAWNDAAARQKK